MSSATSLFDVFRFAMQSSLKFGCWIVNEITYCTLVTKSLAGWKKTEGGVLLTYLFSFAADYLVPLKHCF